MRWKILLIISLIFWIVKMSKSSAATPEWATNYKGSDKSGHYIVCSGDDKSPELARKKAETNCVASIVRLSGAETTIKEKSLINLSSMEFESKSEFDEIKGSFQCDYKEQAFESIEDGHRVWLLCYIPKSKIERFTQNEKSKIAKYGPVKMFERIDVLEQENRRLKKELAEAKGSLDTYTRGYHQKDNEAQSCLYDLEKARRFEGCMSPPEDSVQKRNWLEERSFELAYNSMPLKELLSKLSLQRERIDIMVSGYCHDYYNTYTVYHIGRNDLCLNDNDQIIGYCKPYKKSCYKLN